MTTLEDYNRLFTVKGRFKAKLRQHAIGVAVAAAIVCSTLTDDKAVKADTVQA